MARSFTFSSALFHFLYLFFLFFLSLQTMSQPQVHHLRTICNESNNFTRPSSYYSNRSSLLTSLRSRSSVLPGTYAGITRDRSPDSVYGMYFCRGDINKTTCSVCVRTATRKIAQNCTYQKEAFTFYEECMVRVSDYSFFGLLEGPTATLYSPLNFSITSSFGQTFSRKMDKLILRAATMSLSPKPYFVLDRERVTEFGSSYRFDSVVQCTPDLDPTNCTVCLRSAVQKLMGCCSRSREAHIFLPKCLLKYDTTSNLPVNVPSLGAIKGEHSYRIYHLYTFYHF